MNAQPPCASNPMAADFCSNATPICNLNGYCGNTSGTYTNWVSNTNHTNETFTPLGNVFCATIQNNSWLKFIADSTIAVFNVWVSNCTGNEGIQMQIYSTTDCYNFTPVSNCWNPGSPTNGQILASGLIPGNVYYFMIDGRQGDICDYVISAHIGVGSTPVVTADQRICKGDSAVVSASGGTAYVWTSIPYDAGLSSQSFLPQIRVKPLQTTTYRVIVTKSGTNAFCPNNTDTLYSVVTVKPVPVINNISSSNDHCGVGDGTATVIVSGGSGVYNYHWNTMPVQNTSTATALIQGWYNVVVTDTNLCKVADSVKVINDTVLEPQIIGNPVLCHGNTAVLSVIGNYSSFLWSTGATTQSITINNGGSYWLKVSKNLCTGDDTLQINEIILTQPSIIGLPYVCSGDSIKLTVSPSYYSYLWSNAIATQSVWVKTGGNYTVTVSDSNLCKSTNTVNIVQKNGPLLQTTTENEICNRSNGSATVSASGGSGNYTYLWNNGSQMSQIINLNSGNYSVAVSDSFCVSKTNVVVYETPGPDANFSVDKDIQIYNGEAVIFNFHDLSAGNIINWQWNFSDNSPYGITANIIHAYNSVGNYLVTLTVTDNNACIDSFSKLVIVRDLFTFYIPNSFTPNGDGVNDIFTPKGTNIDPTAFEMYIYDRWGQMIFSTRNWLGTSSDGWDGTVRGSGNESKIVNGVFVYKILVKELAGPEHQYAGMIAVIP